MKTMLLPSITSPKDLKRLTPAQLPSLAKEIRAKLLEVIGRKGGHLASNLGLVEVSIALHYIFDSPADQIVFDVSHQSYVHKLLTGRQALFEKLGDPDGTSGFTDPRESEHDIFNIGHTSTSISLACGLSKGRDLQGKKNNIIALIGDGSLSGGEAFEGLNNAALLKTNLIIVINDNEVSIDPNFGGLYTTLGNLRASNGTSENNYFKSLGLEYRYLDDGHDLVKVLAAFSEVKDINHPIVLHIHTTKGKGCAFAEREPTTFHYSAPFDPTTGARLLRDDGNERDVVSYMNATLVFLNEELKNHKSVLVEPGSALMGSRILPKFPHSYIDTGITEEHAVAFCSGVARNGGKPYLSIVSSFVQRAFDQIHQDLCLNNTPATLLIQSAGMWCYHDSHVGLYDIAMLSNIPNLVYLAPTNEEECVKMLEFARDATYPTAIRLARFPSQAIKRNYAEIPAIEKGKSEIVKRGERIALFGLGDFLYLAFQVADLLEKKMGWKVTIINPRFASHLDEELLCKLKMNHLIFVTLENGIIDGGFGQKVASFLGKDDVRVLNFGVKKEFTDRVPIEEQRRRYRLTPSQIVEDIASIRT